jgi:hypothetical protein
MRTSCEQWFGAKVIASDAVCVCQRSVIGRDQNMGVRQIAGKYQMAGQKQSDTRKSWP